LPAAQNKNNGIDTTRVLLNEHRTPATPHRISVALPAGSVTTDLRPILARVHDDALRKRAQQVILDLRGAGPLGIAGLQHFVGWILEIKDLPTAERYTVHFIGDGADHWQKRGLQALRACAEDDISLSFGEVEGNA
jgi:hypothetical protein